MAGYSKSVKILGIAHIVFGILLFICGIGDHEYGFFWTRSYYFGIWIGILMIFTGFLGIAAGRNKRNSFNCAFMFFALTPAVLCLAIVVIYGISISSIGFLARIFFPLARTVAYGMIVVGSIGTVIGLFATIFSCLTCCAGPATPEDSGERVVHNASPGYILVQGPDGLPMAVPVQGNATGSTLQGSPLKAQKDQPQMMLMPFSGKVAHDPQAGSAGLVAGQLSTLETQGLYPQLKPMPTSGEVGGEPQFVPTADTSGGIVTGCQPQQNGMGWSYLEENQGEGYFIMLSIVQATLKLGVPPTNNGKSRLPIITFGICRVFVYAFYDEPQPRPAIKRVTDGC